MGVYTSGPGYNGVTGAKATYDAGSGMWVDTNGERIRTDAIVPGEPPAQAAAPAAPAAPAPAAAAPAAPAGDPQAAPMQALAGAAQGFQELNSATAINPKLGNRLNPSTMQALASMAGRNY